MNRCLIALSCMVVMLAASTASGATQVDTFVVPIDGTSGTSNIALLSGVPYLLEVSGTFFIGGPGDGLADAEYFDFSNPPTSVLNISGGGVDLGVRLNGSKPSWGAYQSSHVYTLPFSGLGSTISADYDDNPYSDNIGSLTMKIFQVPEPSSAVLLCLGAAVVLRRRFLSNRRL